MRQITKSPNKHCPAVSTLQASDPTARTLPSATAALSSRPCGWQLAHFQDWDWTLLWTGFPQTTPYPVWGSMHFCVGNSPLKHPAGEEGHREAVSSYRTDSTSFGDSPPTIPPLTVEVFPTHPHYLHEVGDTGLHTIPFELPSTQ